MKTLATVVFTIALITSSNLHAQLRVEDKVRINEAKAIAHQYGNAIWENFNSVPFTILMVIDSLEYLINHPNPSSDFILLAYDDVLQTNVYQRKRVFSPKLLATFPAINGVPTIVIGTPENTNTSSTEWIITLLHEHFHQYQMFDKEYFSAVNKLELSGGDETGMWMLNYPFPYDSLPVVIQYNKLTNTLHDALLSKNNRAGKKQIKRYFKEREKLMNLLKPADYRYISFQIWQEGLARYTEYKFLDLLNSAIPSKEVTVLNDFTPYSKQKQNIYERELNNLKNLKLPTSKRVAFYTLGFAEGLLLDRINKNWRKHYLQKKFFIEKYW